MIPNYIEYKLKDKDYKQLVFKRYNDNTFSIDIIDDSGTRCGLILNSSQMLDLSDIFSIMVLGNGKDE